LRVRFGNGAINVSISALSRRATSRAAQFEGVAAVDAEVASIEKRLLFLRHEKRADFRKPEVVVFFQLEIGKSRTAGGVLDGALQGDAFVPALGAWVVTP
jgi:hypothetical protein